jgi:ACT domain-containing protein
MVQSIIACPKTLIELVLDPDCNRDYEEFDERIDALNHLKSLIHSYKVNLYILPSSLMMLHFYLRKSASHNFANRAISELLNLGNVNFGLDYEHDIGASIALLENVGNDNVLSKISLYEALILPAAAELRVSALVISEPILLKGLLELRNHHSYFDIPILSIREAVAYLSERESHSFSGEGDILVRTPRGTIKKLRKGSTVIDFAFAVHTDIGSKCIGALVNHEKSPLDRVLVMNDMVEILLGEDLQTNETWLEFTKTRTARKAIKQSIRKSFQDKGWNLIKNEFNIRAVRPQLDALARTMNLTTNRLVERVGRDLLSVPGLSILLQQVVIDKIGNSSDSQQGNGHFVIGGNHQLWKQSLSSCCKPFPGDNAVGIVGINDDVIRIHRRECENIANVQQDKLINAIWGCSSCSVELYLAIKDSPDTLRQILNHLADNGLTIDLRNVQTTKDLIARSTITLPIRSRSEMDKIVDLLQAMPNVSQVKVKRTQPISDEIVT